MLHGKDKNPLQRAHFEAPADATRVHSEGLAGFFRVMNGEGIYGKLSGDERDILAKAFLKKNKRTKLYKTFFEDAPHEGSRGDLESQEKYGRFETLYQRDVLGHAPGVAIDSRLPPDTTDLKNALFLLNRPNEGRLSFGEIGAGGTVNRSRDAFAKKNNIPL